MASAIQNMLPTYFLTSSSFTMLSPLYLSPSLLFSLSHTHSPGLLHSHSSPSNLYLGAMLVAPTHSHQAFQCIPTNCRAYHTLAFLTHILMHVCMHKPTQLPPPPLHTHTVEHKLILVKDALFG